MDGVARQPPIYAPAQIYILQGLVRPVEQGENANLSKLRIDEKQTATVQCRMKKGKK